MDPMSKRFLGRHTDVNRATEMFKGMLGGIAADYRITPDELREIVFWFDRHENLLTQQPFREIALLMNRILDDDVVDEGEHQELLDWFQALGDPNNVLQATADEAIRRLHGFMDGISLDGVVSEAEVRDMWDWLQNYAWCRDNWPFCDLWAKLEHVLADGRVTPAEREDLQAYCRNFGENVPTGPIPPREVFNAREEPWMISEAPILKSIACVCDPVCPVVVPGRTFCFTGAARTGKRKDLEALVTQHRGSSQPRVTWDLHYLVVGDLSNPCWAFASYGRKIEAAVENQRGGSTTTIIMESRFVEAVGKV